MRHRELIRRLKDDRKELRRASPGLFSSHPTPQQSGIRRLELLHDLENLLPEIIEKLEQQPRG